MATAFTTALGLPDDGELTLFRVQPGAFQPVQRIPVAADGTYAFTQVVLDDYQIRGLADTLVHERAIPTYYKNTIFWEEADRNRTRISNHGGSQRHEWKDTGTKTCYHRSV